MNPNLVKYYSFSKSDIEQFSVPMKIGILGTVNEAGLPHLTLISTLGACGPSQVIWGQFTEGQSKKHVRVNPKTGFLIMTLDKQLWRGKANWTHIAQGGPEFDMYNNVPMFRYNAYFGVHTVYYMDLVEHYGQQTLPMPRVVFAAIQTMIAKRWRRNGNKEEVLNIWTRGLLDKLDNLKFLSYIGEDGYPLIIPVIQAQTADNEHLLFSLGAYGNELDIIPVGVPVAVFGMSLDMEDVLLRGTFLGVHKIAGLPCGTIKVDWVYNPMPPVPGQIYPELDVEVISKF